MEGEVQESMGARTMVAAMLEDANVVGTAGMQKRRSIKNRYVVRY